MELEGQGWGPTWGAWWEVVTSANLTSNDRATSPTISVRISNTVPFHTFGPLADQDFRMSALFRFFQNGLKNKMAKEEVKIERMEESDSESEEEFVLAKSHTENSSEPDEMVVPLEKPKEEVNTGEGEAQDKMNKEAIATSTDRSKTSFLEATIADISSGEASCSPKANKAPLGDETLLGQMWGKYNKQADMTNFQDTTLRKVLSDAVLSPEMKSPAEKRAAGDKTLTSALWGKFDAQADQTNYQDTSLCQILAKVTVSPEQKEGRLGEKTMLRNLWSKVIMVFMR